MQKISEQPLVKCPACGELALKKLISAAGFRLSGSGWYETDFKKSGQRNLAKRDSTKTDAKDSSKSKPSDKPKSSAKTKSASSDR
jgi:predicted nucleic acid-binding Zn ribbon protein